MKKKRLADRYAKAAFELAKENDQLEKFHRDIELVATVVERLVAAKEVFQSPATTSERSRSLMRTLLEHAKVEGLAAEFLMLVAARRRASVLSEIASSLAEQIDQSLGVTRGRVRSTNVLAPAERERIEATVGKALNKKVILTYVQDSAVLGGLVAEVGSFRFDDSLASHLNRMSEDLKRRPVEYGSADSRG